MAAHSIRLLRWLGWRRLPTARPATEECAIQSPSARSGANTCTSATAACSTPTTAQAPKKSRATGTASGPAAATWAARSTTAAATHRPVAPATSDKACAPAPQGSNVPTPTSNSAASAGAMPRQGAGFPPRSSPRRSPLVGSWVHAQVRSREGASHPAGCKARAHTSAPHPASANA